MVGGGCFLKYRSGPPGNSKEGNEESNLSVRKKKSFRTTEKSLDIIQSFKISLIRTTLNDFRHRKRVNPLSACFKSFLCITPDL